MCQPHKACRSIHSRPLGHPEWLQRWSGGTSCNMRMGCATEAEQSTVSPFFTPLRLTSSTTRRQRPHGLANQIKSQTQVGTVNLPAARIAAPVATTHQAENTEFNPDLGSCPAQHRWCGRFIAVFETGTHCATRSRSLFSKAEIPKRPSVGEHLNPRTSADRL